MARVSAVGGRLVRLNPGQFQLHEFSLSSSLQGKVGEQA